MQSVTGQYECVHSSGVGLDYFTSRIDCLILHVDGRFVLTVQQRSRVTHAAQSLMSGEQLTATTPQTRLEGNYVHQDPIVALHFDNGGLEEAHLSANGDGLQIGPNYFTKVSDSTLLPSTQRLKQDMEDIAKGLKIAKTIGGMAAKAAKTIQGTLQPNQGAEIAQTPPQSSSVMPQGQSVQQPTSSPTSSHATSGPQSATGMHPQTPSAVYCEQCGTRNRPGKRFCNHCGAPLT
jgi:hypothetical protein